MLQSQLSLFCMEETNILKALLMLPCVPFSSPFVYAESGLRGEDIAYSLLYVCISIYLSQTLSLPALGDPLP